MTLKEEPNVIPFKAAADEPASAAPVQSQEDGDRGKVLEFTRVHPGPAANPRNATVSVIVVSNDDELREHLVVSLDRSHGVELLAATDDPIMTVAFAQGMSPDVAIVEIDPGHEELWIKTAHAVREASPETGVVVIAGDTETEYVEHMMNRQAGGWSYLLRDSAMNPDALMRAVDGAAWGIVTVDPTVYDAERMVLYGLNAAEQQTLRLMALGYTDDAIVGRLGRSPDDVANTQEAVYDKLSIAPDASVDRRVRAVMTYHLAMHFAQDDSVPTA